MSSSSPTGRSAQQTGKQHGSNKAVENAPVPKYTCAACYNTTQSSGKMSNFHHLACSHDYCNECITEFIKARVGAFVELGCCNIRIYLIRISSRLPFSNQISLGDYFTKFSFLAKSELEADCANRKCFARLYDYYTDRSRSAAYCRVCTSMTCLGCGSLRNGKLTYAENGKAFEQLQSLARRGLDAVFKMSGALVMERWMLTCEMSMRNRRINIL